MSTEPNKMTETNYTLGVPDGIEQGQVGGGVVSGVGVKQGHRCCGGCCDVRRATIVVDIIHACLIGMSLMSVLAAHNLASSNAVVYDDDTMAAALDEFKNQPMGVFLASTAIQVVAALCGIAGAVKFNVPLVGVAAASYVVQIILALIRLDVIGLIYPGFFLYPHVFLIKEMRAGIMTPENYPNEKHSCCCV